MSTTAFIITLVIISVCACLINAGLGFYHRKRAWVLPVRLLAGLISLAPLLALLLSRAFSLHLMVKLGLTSTANAFAAIGVFIALTLMLPSWIDRAPKEAVTPAGAKGQKVGAGKGRVRVINGSDEWVN